MEYTVIGGPLNGQRISWRMAKILKRDEGYRAPTLGESVAWGWPGAVVWGAL